ncbi:MAG: WYL domain-containing protein [Bacteroidales bacterium]|nr:WYL domain-containing protein [Bacteroidales bacterium]
MPVDKNKLIRFQTLDRCFSDQVNKYYIEDLIKACSQALANAGCESPSISRSSIYTDISELTSNSDWEGANLIPKEESTDGRRRFYRYEDPNFSIWKRDIDDFQLAQLQSIMLMLRQFKDFPQIDAIEDIIHQLEQQYKFKLEEADGIIAFEANENLDALSLVGTMFSYISHKRVLEIVYQPFNKQAKKYVIHPHFLKQYNRRWFLIGFTIDKGMMSRSVFALDRIQSIEQVAGEYISSDMDLEDIFYDQIGVTLTKELPVVISLQFSLHRFKYVLTKPIHASQKILSNDGRVITIEVIPNKELYQTLISFGSDVKVLAPDNVRQALSEIIQSMYKIYNCPE